MLKANLGLTASVAHLFRDVSKGRVRFSLIQGAPEGCSRASWRNWTQEDYAMPHLGWKPLRTTLPPELDPRVEIHQLQYPPVIQHNWLENHHPG